MLCRDFSSLAYLALGSVSGGSARIAGNGASPTMGAGPAIWGTGMSHTLTPDRGSDAPDRSRRLAKGLTYASLTVAMLGLMHGFGELTSLVWLAAGLLAIAAVAAWTHWHRAQFEGVGVGRKPSDGGIGNGRR